MADTPQNPTAFVCLQCGALYGEQCTCPKCETKPHEYLSTACYHDEHDRCRKVCKFCAAACWCECHEIAAVEDSE